MNPVNTLYYCLRAVVDASGTQGIEDTVQSRTRAYIAAYLAHYVPHSISIPVAGEELNQFFGQDPDALDDSAKANVVLRAKELAADEGWPEVRFDIDLDLSTALGTMAARMYHLNGGGL